MLTSRSLPPTPNGTRGHRIQPTVGGRTYMQQQGRQLRRLYRRVRKSVQHCCNSASWLLTATLALLTTSLVVLFYVRDLQVNIGSHGSGGDVLYRSAVNRAQSSNSDGALRHLQRGYQLTNSDELSAETANLECSTDHSVYELVSQTIPRGWLVLLHTPCQQAILQSSQPIYLSESTNSKRPTATSAVVTALARYYKTLTSNAQYIAVLSVPAVSNSTSFDFLRTYTQPLQQHTPYISFELDRHVCAQLNNLPINEVSTYSRVWDQLQLPKDTVKPDVLCNGASWNYAFSSDSLQQYPQNVWQHAHKTFDSSQMDAMALILPHLLRQPAAAAPDLYAKQTTPSDDSLRSEQASQLLLNDTIPHSHSLRELKYSRNNDYLNWQHAVTVVTLDHPNADLLWMRQLPYSIALYVYGIELQGRYLTSTSYMPYWSDVHVLDRDYEDAAGNKQHHLNITSKHFALTYLRFIVDHYDQLPAHMVFMRPDRYIHSSTTNATRDKTQLLKRLKHNEPGNDYMPLGIDDHTCHRTTDLSTNTTMLDYNELWNSALVSNWFGSYPSMLCYQPGGEFAVSRAAVLRNRKSVYQQLYSEMLRVAVPTPAQQATLTGYDHGLDPFWHVLFRQPAVSSWRTPSKSIYSADKLRWVGNDRQDREVWQAKTAQYNDSELEMPQLQARQPTADVNADLTLPWSGVRVGKHNNLTAALVVAAHKEDLSWLERYIPSLPHLTYVQGDPEAALQSHGHCNEASAYLTYIAQYYDHLPDLTVFLHGHQEAWHSADVTATLRTLNWDYLYANGYHSLNCKQTYTMAPEGVNNREEYPHFRQIHNYWNDFSRGRLGEQAPDLFTNYCCSQFVIDKQSIQRHPRSYYIELYQHCRQTTVLPKWTGRVFEFVFPIIFGKPAVVKDDPQICCKISESGCTMTSPL